MDFEFTDDQLSLRDAVARWVDKGFSFERRHGIAKKDGHTRDVYGELADLGLTGLAVHEPHGGMGFGAVEAMVVMEELGRGLVNAPYAAGALVAPSVLAQAPDAVQSAWLPRLASGETLIVLAHQERASRYRLAQVATTAKRAGNGWQLSGHKSVVPAADEADAFIVPARTAGAADDAKGIALFLVEKGAKGTQIQGYPTQDGARAGELKLADTPATLIEEDAPRDARARGRHRHRRGLRRRCRRDGQAGGADGRVHEHWPTHFGTTLATFQALRHRIADVKMQLELGRSMSYFASLKLAEPLPHGAARCRRPRCNSATRCASSVSSARSCTAASASPTSTSAVTTSSA